MTIYSPLDNIQLVTDLLPKIRHEKDDLIAQIEYEEATGKYPVDDRDYKHVEALYKLVAALQEYLRDKSE